MVRLINNMLKKKKVKSVKKGYHIMPNGKMMSDSKMEEYHRTRGKSWAYKMSGGRMK